MKTSGLCAKALNHNISPYWLLVSFLFFIVQSSNSSYIFSDWHTVGFFVAVLIYKVFLFWGKHLTYAASELRSRYQVYCDPAGNLQMWIEVELRLSFEHPKKSHKEQVIKRVWTNLTFLITHLCDFWQMTKKSGLHLKRVGDKCATLQLAMSVKHDSSNLAHNQLSIKVLSLQLCRRKGIPTKITKVYLPLS